MASQYVFFLGRNHDLSMIEVWDALSTAGFNPVYQSHTNRLLRVETPADIPVTFFNRLGGVDRVAVVKTTFPALPTVEDIVATLSPLPAKMSFALNTIDIQAFSRKFLVDIKKAARAKESKLAFIEPKSGAAMLSSAQAFFNGLTKTPNAELSVIPDAGGFTVMQTCWIQDIPAYEGRDTGRTVRDAKVGMLPPKLAQIMLNMGVYATHRGQGEQVRLYDPFCGLGTVIQEGALMAYSMLGSDKESRMVEATKRNLNTLRLSTAPDGLFVHDVMQPFPASLHESIDAIVTEPYLGTPLFQALSPAAAEDFFKSLQPLYTAFFTNALAVLKEGSPLLIALPAVRLKRQGFEFAFIPKPYLDEFSRIGYRLEQLVPDTLAPHIPASGRGTLFYARPDAFVGRELTLWRKHNTPRI